MLSVLASYVVLAGMATSTGGAIVTHEATYEDINTGINGVTTTTPPSPYLDLNYNSFSVYGSLAPGTFPISGVVTHSPPQGILTGSTDQATSGTPSLTVAPPYKSVTFDSFYFGCSLSIPEGAVDEATTCTVTVKGYSQANEQLAMKTFTFDAPLVSTAKVPQVLARLDKTFSNVYKITLVQDNPVEQGLLIDNVKYTVSK
ncbi:MAG: hypothetical protein Q9167_004934 [Letrouitia subvulpina]